MGIYPVASAQRYGRVSSIPKYCIASQHVDGLVQERRNSSALAMALHISCT